MIWFLAFTARMTSFWLNNLWDLRPILCDKQPEEVIYAFVKDHRFCWMHALLWNILGEARDECLYFLLLSVAFLILFCVIFFKSLHISPLSHVTCTLFDYNHTIFSHLSNVPFLFFSFSFFFFPSADNENHTKGDSPKATSASASQEPLWRSSQPQAQAQTQTQVQSQPQAHSSVKLQIQPQNITQRNHTVSRKYSHFTQYDGEQERSDSVKFKKKNKNSVFSL